MNRFYFLYTGHGRTLGGSLISVVFEEKKRLFYD
jgi:hypothetical protein